MRLNCNPLAVGGRVDLPVRHLALYRYRVAFLFVSQPEEVGVLLRAASEAIVILRRGEVHEAQVYFFPLQLFRYRDKLVVHYQFSIQVRRELHLVDVREGEVGVVPKAVEVVGRVFLDARRDAERGFLREREFLENYWDSWVDILGRDHQRLIGGGNHSTGLVRDEAVERDPVIVSEGAGFHSGASIDPRIHEVGAVPEGVQVVALDDEAVSEAKREQLARLEAEFANGSPLLNRVYLYHKSLFSPYFK